MSAIPAEEVVKKPRSPIVPGNTIKVKYHDEHSIYVTLNKDDGGKPFEVFVNLGKSGSEHKATAEALGRLISLYLQSGGKVDRVVETLIEIKGGSIHWWDGVAIFSLPDATAKALMALAGADITVMGQCQKCKEYTLKYEAGCWVCTTCGATRCG